MRVAGNVVELVGEYPAILPELFGRGQQLSVEGLAS